MIVRPIAGSGGASYSPILDQDLIDATASPYNATGDGTTDDYAAIQAAINTGKHVYLPIPASAYKITQGLVFVAKNQHIFGFMDIGHNGIYTQATVIKLSADGIWGFHINDASQRLTNIGIIQDPTVTPTSGGGVKIGDAIAYSHWHSLENVVTFQTYKGFYITGLVAGSTYKRCMALRSKTYNFHIDLAVPYGFGQILDCISYHAAADGAGTVGIMISGSDTSRISGGFVSGSETPIYYKADNAGIHQIIFDSVHIENKYNATSYAIRLGDSVNNISDCKFSNLHILPAQANYGTVYLGGMTQRCSISNCDFQNGGIIDIGTNNQIINNVVNTGSTGIQLNGNGSIVLGNKVYGCTYGLNVIGGTNYTIVGNNFSGNTTVASIASSSKASSIIANNQGIVDYETSISTAPYKIGCRALVSNEWYTAINTSSTSDWVKDSGGGGVDGGLFTDTYTITGVDGGGFI